MAQAGATGRGGVRRFTPNGHVRTSHGPSARGYSGDAVGDNAPPARTPPPGIRQYPRAALEPGGARGPGHRL